MYVNYYKIWQNARGRDEKYFANGFWVERQNTKWRVGARIQIAIAHLLFRHPYLTWINEWISDVFCQISYERSLWILIHRYGETKTFKKEKKKYRQDTAARKFTAILWKNVVWYDWKRFHRAGVATYTEVTLCQDYKVEIKIFYLIQA